MDTCTVCVIDFRKLLTTTQSATEACPCITLCHLKSRLLSLWLWLLCTKPEYNFRQRTHQKEFILKSVNLNDRDFFHSHVIHRFLLTSAYSHMLYFTLFIILICCIILLLTVSDAHVDW